MGGYGSGRPGRRPVAENTFRIPLSDIQPHIQHVVASGNARVVSLHWQPAGSMLVVIAPGPALTLRYSLNGATVADAVALTSTASNLPGNAGRRWWYLCPRCGRRCGVLFAPLGRFRCRVCHDITYRSCCDSDKRVIRLIRSGLLGRIEPGMLPVSMLILSMKALDMMRTRHARELRKAERAAKRAARRTRPTK